MNAGGAETFLMKVFREAVHKSILFDFCALDNGEGLYDSEIIAMGGHIHKFEQEGVGDFAISKVIQLFKKSCFVYKTVKKNNYKYIMFSTEQVPLIVYLVAARFGGATTIALRSANSKSGKGEMVDNIFKSCSFLCRWASNKRFAPSKLAADFLFGSNAVHKHGVRLIKNGIDTDVFTFSEEKRKAIRKEFAFQDKLVIGHVGRFNLQKNHEFLLRVFNEISRKRTDAILFIVGDGERKELLKDEIRKLKLEGRVIMSGTRTDVANCLMAMDMMVFPSFFEGMPNVIIEAQCTGLPCVVSDSVTFECKVTDRVEFLPLDDTPDEWSRMVLSMHKAASHKCRYDYASIMRKQGYDIRDVADYFITEIFKQKSYS